MRLQAYDHGDPMTMVAPTGLATRNEIVVLCLFLDTCEEELKNASFDPRIGFTIRNLLVKDSNWYKCSIEKDDEEYAVNYVLSVHRKCGLDSRC
ncbi:hypothetical protein ALC53_06918 [Atta colombica]|uniref:Uncharacterized protein n=1 Tax=Atta colombica TaxID=520822 RepID=A0A195BDY8_9HYME|nr:hypothetical protein ALC53_06918 [Atta colombica]